MSRYSLRPLVVTPPQVLGSVRAKREHLGIVTPAKAGAGVQRLSGAKSKALDPGFRRDDVQNLSPRDPAYRAMKFP